MQCHIDITGFPHQEVTVRTRIAKTCERCHSEIYKLYEQSVHGAALIGKGDSNVPTCTDCHTVHNLASPNP
ncbi:MAG: hypothetical protein AB1345_11470 [Chloroflexota bacterium]